MTGAPRKRLILFVLVAALIATSGCASLRPARVSRRGVIQKWTREDPSTRLPFGPARSVARHSSSAPDSGMSGSESSLRKSAATRGALWSWPLREVQITSRFGVRKGDPHDGIDLRAPNGTPIHAIAPGRVIYAARRIRGYGRMVILKHERGWSSVYAHASAFKVRPGQLVRRGQLIAYSGSSGRVTGPHLHFEMRYGTRAVDPEKFLLSPGSQVLTTRQPAPSDRAPGEKRVSARSSSSD